MSGAPGSQPNPLSLSDEDFLNQPLPETGEVSSHTEDNTSTTENTTEEIQTENTEAEQVDTPEQTEENQEKENPDPKNPEEDAEEKPAEGDTPAPGSTEGEAKPEGEATKEGSKTEEKEGDTAGQDRVFQVPTSFTANGKTIQLKDEKEAVQLMQMGANYTRKLQEMAPHRKLLMMLQNNGVADESKLSFFIALDKKDPEAIKKLIKDSGIDPLDLDMNTEPAYREGSYQVTDEEASFRTQMEELVSSDTGKQTLQTINDEWDQASKDMLWQHPEVMSIIHEQRETGIYTKIAEEMDRRRTLGQLPPTTPFLAAYKAIGDELYESGAFGTASPEQDAKPDGQTKVVTEAVKPTPTVVATRRAAPKPVVDNGDKAGAASPSRAAPGKATEVKNFLAMSDDDFIKASGLEGRV